MRRLFKRYRSWWYKRGHRPKKGTLLYSPSLDMRHAFRDAFEDNPFYPPDCRDSG